MIIDKNTRNTIPYFSIDELNGIIEISGRSIDVTIGDHFEPILKYIEDFLEHHVMDITLIINLEYFNSIFSRILVYLLRMIKKSVDNNDCKLIVYWYYDFDDDTHNSGEDFESIIDLPFNYITT